MNNIRTSVLVLLAILLSTMANENVQVRAAFLVEAHETGLAFDDNFEFGEDTFSATASDASTAVGLTAEHSIYGGDAVTDPDTYVFFYSPGRDDDNLALPRGTVLGSEDGSPGEGYTSTGFTGGPSGSYNVYATSPSSVNISGGPSLVTLTQEGDPLEIDLDMNNGMTGSNTQVNPGGAFVGGMNNAWFLLGTVEYESGQTYSVELQAATNTFVSQRIHGILWEFADGGGPVLGDFDDDGMLTAADIDALTFAVLDGLDDPEFDLNADGDVDNADRFIWVNDLANTYFGDANLDGVFNSSDLVTVFGFGQYEDEEFSNSTWGTGDWDGDLDFDSSDFVLSFSTGGYEQGARAQPVPEPSGLFLVLCVAASLIRARANAFRTQHAS